MKSRFRAGSGDPPVLIHGFAHTWRAWEPVLPALTERREVLAPRWLGEMDSPVLVCWPEHDRLLPVKGHSKPFPELVRGAEWRDMRGRPRADGRRL